MPMIELKNITGGYKKSKNILSNIDLSIKEGEILAVIGQNGSGKSTLAKLIMNLITPVAGDIFYLNENITKKTTAEIQGLGIGYLMQGGCVFPNLTVEENLNFAGINIPKNRLKERIREVNSYFQEIPILDSNDSSENGFGSSEDKYNLFDKKFLDRESSLLSGGEKHKLALSMVLLQKPIFLILDEPSAGLSPEATKSLYNVLGLIKNKEVASILLIEQKVYDAVRFSDRVVKLGNQKILDEETSENLNTQEKIEKFVFEKLIK